MNIGEKVTVAAHFGNLRENSRERSHDFTLRTRCVAIWLPWLPIYLRVFNLQFQWRKDELDLALLLQTCRVRLGIVLRKDNGASSLR